MLNHHGRVFGAVGGFAHGIQGGQKGRILTGPNAEPAAVTRCGFRARRNIACRFVHRILHTRAMIRASRRLPTGADAEW